MKAPREIHAVNTRRICLIEDEEAIAEGISEVLSFHDIGVDAVTRGAEAHAAVRRFNPDVVLLDIGLPDVDGIEVGRRLRAVWPNLPIIFITGHGDEARIEFADERTRFLQKPFEMGSLIETIAELERPEVVA